MRIGILACTIGRAKNFAIPKLREIARVAYFGQITSIESSRARKLEKVRSQKSGDVSMRDWARDSGCRLRIMRNCVGNII